MKRIWALLICAAIILSAVSCGQADKPLAAEEYLSLGEKFLLDLEYEQALVQFLKLIEIEPMNPRGYTGAADVYTALGQLDGAIAILEQGLEEIGGNADIEALLEEILMTPREFSSVNSDGETVVTFGQTDPEGRLQGFCIINIYAPDGSLTYMAEGEYIDGEPSEIKNWWIPDTNVNEQYGVTAGCGRGSGEYRGGERNGYSEVTCYLSFTVSAAAGEIVRWQDITGIDPIYEYRGNFIADMREDGTGTAYLMYISRSEAHAGQKVEYTGQFKNDERHGYGIILRDGAVDFEGQWENGSPVIGGAE